MFGNRFIKSITYNKIGSKINIIGQKQKKVINLCIMKSVSLLLDIYLKIQNTINTLNYFESKVK